MKTSVPVVYRTSTYYTEFVAKRIRERRGGIPDELAITEYHGKTYITETHYSDKGIPTLRIWPISRSSPLRISYWAHPSSSFSRG